MRILVTTRFYRNGQTTHVLTLCAELVRQGYQVFLNISHLDYPNYGTWLKENGVPFSSGEPLKLARFLGRWRPHLIHNHSSHSLEAALILGEKLKIPTLTTVHYLDFNPVQLLEKQGGVIVISREMEEGLALTTPTFLLENGIHLPQQGKRKKFHQRALFLAQVSKGKLQNFSEMANCLLEWGWEVRIAGNWRYPGAKSLGWLNDVWPALKWADLVIGTGRAVREGMAASCAVWVLGDYSDGLVTPGNVNILSRTNYSGRHSKESFRREAGAPFLQKPNGKFFRELGGFGSQYARKYFSLQHKVHKLIQIYQVILENHSISETGNLEIMSNITTKGGIDYETGDYSS